MMVDTVAYCVSMVSVVKPVSLEVSANRGVVMVILFCVAVDCCCLVGDGHDLCVVIGGFCVTNMLVLTTFILEEFAICDVVKVTAVRVTLDLCCLIVDRSDVCGVIVGTSWVTPKLLLCTA